MFSNDASLDDIVLAGELALCWLYGSRSSEVLDALLYIHLTEKVTRRTTDVQLHSLPPTAAAAVYHSARVYFQLHEWMGKSDKLDPENGDGSKHGVDMNHEQQIYHLLQMISWKSSGANAKQTVIRECAHARITGWSVQLNAANAKELAAPTPSWFQGKKLNDYEHKIWKG